MYITIIQNKDNLSTILRGEALIFDLINNNIMIYIYKL